MRFYKIKSFLSSGESVDRKVVKELDFGNVSIKNGRNYAVVSAQYYHQMGSQLIPESTTRRRIVWQPDGEVDIEINKLYAETTPQVEQTTHQPLEA